MATVYSIDPKFHDMLAQELSNLLQTDMVLCVDDDETCKAKAGDAGDAGAVKCDTQVKEIPAMPDVPQKSSPVDEKQPKRISEQQSIRFEIMRDIESSKEPSGKPALKAAIQAMMEKIDTKPNHKVTDDVALPFCSTDTRTP